MSDVAGVYERRLDDLEFDDRRQNLRIVAIPRPSNGCKESAEEVLEKVKDAIAELDIPNLNVDEVINRAHRVGKKFKRDGSNEEIHPIIARFTSWRSRTAVYRKRKKRGRTHFYRDLTKRRLDLKKLTDAKTKDNEQVKFAFADVNNNIRLHLADHKMVYFNSVDELERTLSFFVITKMIGKLKQTTGPSRYYLFAENFLWSHSQVKKQWHSRKSFRKLHFQ